MNSLRISTLRRDPFAMDKFYDRMLIAGGFPGSTMEEKAESGRS